METAELAKTLSSNYLFRGLGSEFMGKVAEMAKVREFEGGDQLVRQFDASSDLMILLEGSAITRTFKGEVVAKFGPGSAIGEVALVDRQKRSANVTSVGKSTAAVLPADALWQLLEADPQVGLVVMRRLAAVLCFRLRSMNEYADTAAPMRGETTARK